MRLLASLGAVALLALTVSAQAPLQIYFIDTEGGQATLLVTPAKESVLIDAGYGPRAGRGTIPPVTGDRDPERILDAAKHAGITRIDYLVVTHFHPDHAGGVPELAKRIPIGTFVDYGEPLGTPYGPDRMAGNTFANYLPVRNKGQYMMARPGDVLPLKGVEARVVTSAGGHITRPLEGGGDTNSACTGLEEHPEDGTENFRSVGLLFRYGAFKFLDLGDLSGMTLTRLACPKNLLGTVSVLLTPHHGDYDGYVPALYAALKPRVIVMNNGTTHGGSPMIREIARTQPGVEDLWQLHLSMLKDADNADEAFIANLDDGRTTGFGLRLTAESDGSFTVTNTRNAHSRTYSRSGATRTR